MYITKENMQSAFEKLEKTKEQSTIPSWEQLPAIELYMDQVIILLNKYVNTNIPITQSMVNNYVKLKAVPAPVKKRYGKIHLAYLIIFCTLKQTLSISKQITSNEFIKLVFYDFLTFSAWVDTVK